MNVPLSTAHVVSQRQKMKVAIAGTNGLAECIAYYLSAQSYHQFVILSRWVSLNTL